MTEKNKNSIEKVKGTLKEWEGFSNLKKDFLNEGYKADKANEDVGAGPQYTDAEQWEIGEEKEQEFINSIEKTKLTFEQWEELEALKEDFYKEFHTFEIPPHFTDQEKWEFGEEKEQEFIKKGEEKEQEFIKEKEQEFIKKNSK